MAENFWTRKDNLRYRESTNGVPLIDFESVGKTTDRAAKQQHNRLVKFLNESHRWLAWPGISISTHEIAYRIRSFLWYLYITNTASIEDIAEGFSRAGYPIALSTLSSAMRGNRPPKHKLPKDKNHRRALDQVYFDSAVVRVVNTLGEDNVDPRIKMRFQELRGDLPKGESEYVSSTISILESLNNESQ